MKRNYIKIRGNLIDADKIIGVGEGYDKIEMVSVTLIYLDGVANPMRIIGSAENVIRQIESIDDIDSRL